MGDVLVDDVRRGHREGIFLRPRGIGEQRDHVGAGLANRDEIPKGTRGDLDAIDGAPGDDVCNVARRGPRGRAQIQHIGSRPEGEVLPSRTDVGG